MIRLLVTTTLLLGLASEAHAGFKPKTQRWPLSVREVERPLILPKGWVELDLGFSQKVANGAWTSDGQARTFDTKRWIYTKEHVGLRLGISPRAELWWDVPFVQASLQHHGGGDAVEWRTSDGSLGDPSFGWKYEIVQSEAPRTSVIGEAWYKAPAASEAPGTYIGGPLNLSQFVFTTGTPDIGLGVAAKQQVGPAAFTGRAGYVRRFSAVVQYLVELENYQFSGRIEPGDLVYLDAGVMVQGGPVAFSVTPRFQYRGTTRMGTTSPGVSANRTLKPVTGSDGWSLDMTGQVLFNASRGFDLALFADVPVRGEDLMFFPIEDLHPTRGLTLGTNVEVRY